jgi:hypothetical protein
MQTPGPIAITFKTVPLNQSIASEPQLQGCLKKLCKTVCLLVDNRQTCMKV